MKPRRSWSDRLLDGKRRGEPPITHTDCRDCGQCLLFRFRGNRSNFLSNESHHTVCKRRPIECAFNGVPHALWKVGCRNDRVHTRHARGVGRVDGFHSRVRMRRTEDGAHQRVRRNNVAGIACGARRTRLPVDRPCSTANLFHRAPSPLRCADILR
jgi:hypothetical protein